MSDLQVEVLEDRERPGERLGVASATTAMSQLRGFLSGATADRTSYLHPTRHTNARFVVDTARLQEHAVNTILCYCDVGLCKLSSRCAAHLLAFWQMHGVIAE